MPVSSIMMPEARHIVAFSTFEKVMGCSRFHRLLISIMTILVVGVALLGLVACGTDGPTETPPATVDTLATNTPGQTAQTEPEPTSTPHKPTPPQGQVPATPPPGSEKDGTVPVEDDTHGLPVPPERDLYRLARELIPGLEGIQPVAAPPAPPLSVGHRQQFELVDLQHLERYSKEFVLRMVTPNAYWFVEEGANVDDMSIRESAEIFEDSTYPRITGVFGTEWKPGVDGDPRLFILNARLNLVGGYYSPADEYPREIRPVSNEIEAVYINVRYISPGTRIYDQVLAHELQHAIHWYADPTEETWFNEGLSELAVTLAGYEELSIREFLRAGPTSLTIWPAGDVGGAANYGAASLFAHYFTEHYGGRDDLRPLLSQQADGVEGVNDYLEYIGESRSFEDIFRDWGVANVLDEATGRYGYSELNVAVPVFRRLKPGDEQESSVPQYSTSYVRLRDVESEATLSFDGELSAILLPTEVGDGCWWSNAGDSIDSRLIASADLRQWSEPRLDFQVWYSIEEDWDYVYLEISTDQGATWQILETAHTSSSNPLSSAFGPGYTGSSDAWLQESISLQDWAGREVMLRFQYVTDAAINDHGLCVRNTALAGESGQPEPLEWVPEGFVWTNNAVRQAYNVQVIYEGQDGAGNRVDRMQLDASNKGEIVISPHSADGRIIVAVQAMAPSTRMPGSYSLGLESAE